MSPLVCYEEKRFGEARVEMIRHANEIIAEYAAEGYNLTPMTSKEHQ